MLLELVMLVLGVAALGLLVRPGLRRRPLPAWLVRARARRRPGVPVLAWLLASGLMTLAWAIGERRGLFGLLLLLIWLGAPLGAAWISLLWLRPGRSGNGSANPAAGPRTSPELPS